MPALSPPNRVRLREAFRLAEVVAERAWPGWSGTPFGVLLVTEEHEFLVGQPRPEGFDSLGHDALLDTEVLVRPRNFDPNLLATFPAFGSPSTVIVGTAEATGKSSTYWVLTLLHEHFHQFQNALPEYFNGAEALDLAGEDRTGMWMLNYPFPYDDEDVRVRFGRFAEALHAAATDDRSSDWRARWRALLERLDVRDARYLRFQLWQEGVARYVEDRVAHLAAGSYTPTPEFLALGDHTPFAEAAREIRRGILEELRAADLAAQRRVAFYAVGAAMALLMDDTDDGWKRRYVEQMFDIDP